ncbi:MAG: MurR/RpiR family transcriptional regulator [Oscillospiraceae bacterium]|nr:MurR/RpiR family transcriptional regulator [Oscillospiraceae bacterium]
MPYGDVFTRINREYYQLTGAERKIADHIMHQRHDCQYMSISELAEEANVAEATVSRFCRRLGYKGYSAFKLAVAGAAAGTTPVNPLYGEIDAEDDVSEMCRKLYAVNVESITQTMDMLDPASVSAAAELLIGAERVLCMGLGGSMVLALEAAHLFSTALPNFYAVADSHFQAIRCSMLTPRDVVLYYSYSGSSKDQVDVMKIARERGAKTILITRFPKSPGAACADVVLECGSRESPLQMGSVAARMSQLYLTDVLFNEVCRRDVDACRERRSRVADALADKHL